MSIYTLDTDFVGENLMPPQIRTPKHLAWLKVILKPLNFFGTNIFNYYQNGDATSIVTNEFIGASERIKYSSQKLLFEYALNKSLFTTGIYIENNFIASDVVFLMGNSGEVSSLMPNSSVNQIHYLGNTPNYVTDTNDFTIYVPTIWYASLGTYNEQLIRNIADKYVLAGITYNVTAY